MAEEKKKPAESAKPSEDSGKAAKAPARKPRHTAEQLREMGLDPTCYGYARSGR